MEQRLSLVTLGVSDLERARRFYEDGLGWRRSGEHAGVVFFQLGGMALALWGREDLARDAMTAGEGHGFSGLALGHNVRAPAEVEHVLAQAKAAGAWILKSAEATEWGGRNGYFCDPDGHVWEVAWNPHWPMGEDGSVTVAG